MVTFFRDPFLQILRRLIAGDVDVRQAAVELDRLGPPGFALGTGALTSEEHAKLKRLAPSLRWEVAKLAPGSRLPDVPYGSPEYHTFIRSVPEGTYADPAADEL